MDRFTWALGLCTPAGSGQWQALAGWNPRREFGVSILLLPACILQLNSVLVLPLQAQGQ